MLTQAQHRLLKRSTANARHDRQAGLFRFLADATRLRILAALTRHAELCVTDLAEALGGSLPAVSHHLRILKDSGLVACERRGQLICYWIPNERTAEVRRLLV